jgi:branched-subunit amino acid aminotransferase/4-amino-4-deoxychorismate lyase
MISLNGQLDDRSEPEILKSDSDYPEKSVYTSIRTYGKKPFRLEEHLRRLQESARLEGFELPQTVDQIRMWVLELLAKNHSGEKFIKIIATTKNIVINSRELVHDGEIYKGVRVVTKPVVRDNVKAKYSHVEAQTKAYQEAFEEKAYEALLLNQEKNVITEGSRSNVLWIKDGVLYWCNEALSGITQAEVKKLAEKANIPVKESSLHVDELETIDELFLTQTSKGIVPITSVNEKNIGDGNVGTLTQRLMRAFAELTERL